MAAFGQDVAGRRFGWRQPLAVLGIASVLFGVLPAALTIADGAWFTPRIGLVELVEPQLRPAAEVGDYRVLYLGDPRLIPFPSDDLGGGVAMALVDDGGADLRDRWPVPDQTVDDELRAVIGEIGDASTLRGGRLLAPFGVRYVVVPLIDGATSTAVRPAARPVGPARLAARAARPGPPADHRARFRALREPRRDPDDGCARRRAGGGVDHRRARHPRRRRHVGGHGDAPRRGRHTRGRRRRPRRASSTSARPSTSAGSCRSAARTSTAGRGSPSPPRTTSAPLGRRRCGSCSRWGGRSGSSASPRCGRSCCSPPAALTVPARFRRRMAGDETLIDLDAERGASLTWVDELFAEEEAER